MLFFPPTLNARFDQFSVVPQVRARCDGDEARLLSGEFPFRQASTPKAGNNGGDPEGNENPSGGGGSGGGSGGRSRRDHGDPRTRCSVALDVTVLRPALRQGASGGGGGGERISSFGQGGGLVWFSCLVHRVLDVSSGSSSSIGRSSPGGSRSEGPATARLGRLRLLEGVRVDALFKQDTRRAVDVCPGSQLRIYDPCYAWHDGLAEAVGGGDAGRGGGGGALLMCTQLCEPYPASLSPLPALQEEEEEEEEEGGSSRRGGDRPADPADQPT